MPKKRVLVIEDDQDVSKILQALLSSLDVEVITAADGLEAIKAAGRVRPDLCLVDLHLPKLSGLDVIRVIRAMPELGEIPIAIITGNTTADYIKEAVLLGVSDFLVKANFLSGNSLDRIRRLLDQRSAPAPSTGRRDDRMKVLVVDDDEDVRAQLLTRLAAMNVRVLLAEDGLQAVAVAAAEQPALMLVDLELPRMNGLEVIRVVRSLHGRKGPGVLIVTAQATKAAVEEARELGVQHVISKSELGTPAFESRLRAAVEAAARRPAARRRTPLAR